MTAAACSAWPALAPRIAARLEARSEAALLAAPELDHLDVCAGCRRAALRLDPTLVLRPLVESEPASGADEVEAMRLAVAALRNGRRHERRAARPMWRYAAALALLLGSAALLPLARDRRPAAPSSADAFVHLGALPDPAGAVLPAEFSASPVVEEIDRPEARVYQLGSGDVAVVMIVDETLDV